MAGNALLRWLCAVLLLAIAAPACADNWALPEQRTYFSPDRLTRLSVIPRDLDSQLAYFEDKLGGKSPPGRDRTVGTLRRAPSSNGVAPAGDGCHCGTARC